MRTLTLLFTTITLLSSCCTKAPQKKQRDPAQKQFMVLAARERLAPGTHITRFNTKKVALPAEFYFPSMLSASRFEKYDSMKIIHDIPAGQPLFVHNLESGSQSKPYSHKIVKQGRAFTLKGTEIGGITKEIRDNDHVDIIGFFEHDAKGNKAPRAVTLLENIVVLTVTHNQKSDIQGLPLEDDSVTLLLLMEEVELLTLAKEVGLLTLSLRNPDDRHLSERRAWSTMETIYRGEREKPKPMRRIRQELLGLPKIIPLPGGIKKTTAPLPEKGK